MLEKYEKTTLDFEGISRDGEEFLPHLLAWVLGRREAVIRLANTTKGNSRGGYYRAGALSALAEKWPDETTRKLLEERAVQDEHEGPRRTALEVPAEKWPDETTDKLLEERAGVDGCAASIIGGRHSRFGRILFTRDLNGRAPYLDPTEPIARTHIRKAMKKANIPVEKIDETIRSLSEHMGWNILQGAGKR